MRKATVEWLRSAEMDLENVAQIIDLDDLYIEARYPGELGLLPSGKPTLADAREFFEVAKAVHSRIVDALADNEER